MHKIFICHKIEPYEDLYVDIFAKYFDMMFFHSDSISRQVHILFQSDFYTQSDLALPLSIYSILSIS